MTFSLNPETPTDLLKDLIVSDIAPVHAKPSADNIAFIQGMEEIEASNVSSRKVADEILERYEKVPISSLGLIPGLTGVPGSQRPHIFVDKPEKWSITVKV